MFTYLKQQAAAAVDYVVETGSEALGLESNSEQQSALEADQSEQDQAAAAPETVSPSSVPPFDDGGGFFWQACDDGSFACVETPPGNERALGTVITADSHPDAWTTLDAILQSKVAEIEPPAGDAPPPPAPPTSDEGVIPLIPELVDAVQDAGEAAWEWVGDLLEVDPIGAAKAWWAGEEEAAQEADAGQQETPPEADVGGIDPDKAARREELLGDKADVLETAEDMAENTSVPHPFDQVGKDAIAEKGSDLLKGGKRRDAIEDADTSDLETIKCSEFVNLTLADAGWELDARVNDPGSGLPVAYEDGSSTTFVEVYMVVNTQPEAIGALMDVQSNAGQEGGPVKIETPEAAAEVGVTDGPAAFWYSTQLTFVGKDSDTDHEFGAGLAAVALGGDEVEVSARMPGDLQQYLYTKSDGTYSGLGHSAIVNSVKGYGVVELGAEGSPTLEGGPEVEPGWYTIEAGGPSVVIDGDTRPERVASFTTVEAQLIDANTGRGQDSTGVGSFQDEADHTDRVLSNGRLPTSPWYPWTEDTSREAPSLPSS